MKKAATFFQRAISAGVRPSPGAATPEHRLYLVPVGKRLRSSSHPEERGELSADSRHALVAAFWEVSRCLPIPRVGAGAPTQGCKPQSRWDCPSRRAFTLIEIMVCVAIMGLIMAMGLPSVLAALKKDGMRKALSDLNDCCQNARQEAIMQSHTVSGGFSSAGQEFQRGWRRSGRGQGHGFRLRAAGGD